MSKINKLFNTIFRPLSAQATALENNVVGTEQFTQGTMRKQFIHDVVNNTDEELKMSKAGAASYYQMCRQRAAGVDMYSSHKKQNAKNTKAAKATVQEINVDTSNRWWVGSKETKSVFASFTSRTAAQTHNKNLKSQGISSAWIDSTKVNTEEFKPALAA